MTDTEHGSRPEVVRARRFEVVDEEGRVRATLGMLPSGPPIGALAGVEIRDLVGRLTATVAVGETQSWILLTLAGNSLIQLTVNDHASDAVDARALLVVCDDDGVPVAGWRVTDDGAVEWVGS